MQYSENSIQSANYLREAIPLMVKYSIQPNPLNFALWYAYVSGRNPVLNSELDEIISNYGTCPAEISSDLFRRYIIDDEVKFATQIRENLLNIIGNLSQQTEQRLKGERLFESKLLTALEELQTEAAGSNSQNIAMRLVENAQEASKMAERFRLELRQANTEIEKLRRELHELSDQVSLDALTQLNNRSAFDREIQRMTQESNRKAEPLSLLITDIDHFKQCNDTYGHAVGDKVLRSFAEILKRTSGDIAFAARYGGEEFAVLLPGIALDQAHQIAEQIRNSTQTMKIKYRDRSETIETITTSLGVAQYQHDEKINDYIHRADSALYQAKKKGRNQVVAAH